MKYRIVDRPDAGAREPPVDLHRPTADVEGFAHLAGDAPAGQQLGDADRAGALLARPGLHGEVGRRIEGDQVEAAALDHDADQPLRRCAGHAFDGREPRDDGGVERLVGRLDGEEACREIDQRAARHDDEIGAHAREGIGDALAEGAAGDQTCHADTNRQRDRQAEQQRAQPAPAEILRCQPDQQHAGPNSPSS